VNQFEYISPRTIEEALKILKKEKLNSALIAGCSNVLPNIRDKKWDSKLLVNIMDITELNYINKKGNKICIGATTTITDLFNSEIISKEFKILHQAAQEFADPIIRNRATVGGNLANASPAADLATPFLALGALLKVESAEKKREILLQDFFIGPGKTVLNAEEMISGIEFENNFQNRNGYFIKLGLRKAMTISVATVAVTLKVEEERIGNIRIAMGSVAPIPIRLNLTEMFLKNKEVNNRLIEKAVKIVREEINPISDIRASVEYRRYVSGILFKRAFKKLLPSYINL